MNDLFAKLMEMTTSDNDHEALTALRKANAILKQAKMSWSELLIAPKIDNSFRVPPSKRRPEPNWEGVNDRDDRVSTDDIDPMFEKIFNVDHNDDFLAFLTSVHLQWQRRGYLTEKQYRAIKKTAERING